eukprot:4077282-Amphidinium_carterae.1
MSTSTTTTKEEYKVSKESGTKGKAKTKKEREATTNRKEMDTRIISNTHSNSTKKVHERRNTDNDHTIPKAKE